MRTIRGRMILPAILALGLASAGTQGAEPPAAGQAADTAAFYKELDARFPQNKRLRANRVPAKDLREQGAKLKGWYYVLDLSTVQFIRELSTDDKVASWLVWIPATGSGPDLAPMVFQMPVNDWVKKRKLRRDEGGAGYTYSCGPQVCDQTTVVGEPTGINLDLPVGDQAVVMKVPKIEIVGVADKNGAWLPAQADKK